MISFDGEHVQPVTGSRYQYAGTAVEEPGSDRIDCVATFHEGEQLKHMVDSTVHRQPGESTLEAVHRWAVTFIEALAVKLALLGDWLVRAVGDAEVFARAAMVF